MSSNLVRVRRPALILFGLHGTLAPTDWEDRCIFPYVRDNLLRYLETNWTATDDIRTLIDRLRQQSFDDHFVFETMEAPLIVGFDSTNGNWRDVMRSVTEYVLWQLNKMRSSKETIWLVRLCWMQAYRERAIQTALFDDVLPALQRFRSLGIRVAVHTVMSADVCRLVLSSTTAGDITALIDHFFDQESIGNRREAATYEKIVSIASVAKADILFVCDYGQDVKYACDNGMQGVILIRPGNRRNRDFYLIRFPNTDSLQRIEFG